MKLNIIDLIWSVNPNRAKQDILRRIVKIQEEVGELAQAYLNYTSKHNPKKKTYYDCIEEAVDSAIVSIDVANTIAETFTGSDEAAKDMVYDMFLTKLNKWVEKQTTDVINATE
jgi:NTP pyrophosphatase (non-canonical NTP hydrolase)